MRIIAGKLKGRRLKTPPSQDTRTRPTLDRVRESLFNILNHYPAPQNVADLCAGTGSLGIEALSRGALHCVFFESYKNNLSLIQQNIKDLGLETQSQLVAGPLPKTLVRFTKKLDLIFFDPPYASDLPHMVLPLLVKNEILSAQGLIVLEQDKRSENNFVPEQLMVDDHRIIGDTALWFLRQK